MSAYKALLTFTGAGTCTTAYGYYFSANTNAAATITNLNGLYIDTILANANGATTTNARGIYVANVSGATNNFAILTNSGNVVFNEGGDSATDFRVESDTEANMLFLDANADTDGALYLGGTTNGIKINKGGELVLLGDATVWEDLRLEPVARNTGAKAPSFANWFGGLYLYEFDNAVAGSEKEIFFSVQLPHQWKEGTAIEPHIHWINKSTGTAGHVVRWGIEYSKAKIGDTFSSSPTTVYGTTIAGGGDITTQYEHMLTDFDAISMTGDTISTVIFCRLFRDSANAGDTYTGTAGLLYIDWHYQIDSMGSKTELAK
jgi:hypothetical protein